MLEKVTSDEVGFKPTRGTVFGRQRCNCEMCKGRIWTYGRAYRKAHGLQKELDIQESINRIAERNIK